MGVAALTSERLPAVRPVTLRRTAPHD